MYPGYERSIVLQYKLTAGATSPAGDTRIIMDCKSQIAKNIYLWIAK